jgi:hypothetical protein
MLHQQLAWYVGGPVLGLCVITLRLLLNGRLGVTGGYTNVIESVGRAASPSTGAAGSSSAWWSVAPCSR